jgi:hypothetical protein
MRNLAIDVGGRRRPYLPAIEAQQQTLDPNEREVVIVPMHSHSVECGILAASILNRR